MENLKAYCDANGVPYQFRMVKGRELFCVLDMTQLPETKRAGLNARGFIAAEYDAALAKALVVNDSTAPPRGHLPEGFPGKAAFESAGVATYAKVRKLRDDNALQSVPGIGAKTEADVIAALEVDNGSDA